MLRFGEPLSIETAFLSQLPAHAPAELPETVKCAERMVIPCFFSKADGGTHLTPKLIYMD